MTFIHATGARIKGQGGSFFFSVSTGLDRDVLTRIEGLSDCILEFGTLERKGALVRRMRIKKTRGRKHTEKWIEFSIEAPDGIVFYR
jgi:KaiC/GvpD/RAD55 family RecA-like ATPase